MRRTITTIVLLEFYALFLVFLVLPGGVRTDEAKYLLSIPYPHPPAVRAFFRQLAFLPFHEGVIRFLLATLVVQAVWLVRDIGMVLSPLRRMALAVSWLLSSAVILQAGTVMLSPVTALFGLLFLSLALTPTDPSPRSVPFISLLWLLGLFSAYHTALYVPLVWSALRRARPTGLAGRGRASIGMTVFYLGIPLVLLALYSLGNPLTIASMFTVSRQDSALPLVEHLKNIGWVWIIAGSGIGSILGTWGLLVSGRKDLLLTGFFLTSFLAISSQGYYAILFTPLLVGGVFILLCRRRLLPGVFIPLQLVMAALLLFVFFPSVHSTPARLTTRMLRAQGVRELVLIDGPFGHEWQYESSVPVRRFTPELASQIEERAQAIVCTRQSCEENVNPEVWVRLKNSPVQVWVRR